MELLLCRGDACAYGGVIVIVSDKDNRFSHCACIYLLPIDPLPQARSQNESTHVQPRDMSLSAAAAYAAFACNVLICFADLEQCF